MYYYCYYYYTLSTTANIRPTVWGALQPDKLRWWLQFSFLCIRFNCLHKTTWWSYPASISSTYVHALGVYLAGDTCFISLFFLIVLSLYCILSFRNFSTFNALCLKPARWETRLRSRCCERSRSRSALFLPPRMSCTELPLCAAGLCSWWRPAEVELHPSWG